MIAGLLYHSLVKRWGMREGTMEMNMRSAIAAAFTITTCFLWATGQTVPQELLLVNTLVVGWYFGDKRGRRSEEVDGNTPKTLDSRFRPDSLDL